MMKRTGFLILLAACIAAFVSCRGKQHATMRSMYYWSTDFKIDKAKSEFITRHGIKRLYIRFFDVVTINGNQPTPNATITFSSPVPKGMETIPTVFITNECMKADDVQLPDRIMSRVMKMCKTNDITGVKEIQIDCDWTNSTRNAFFGFMKRLTAIAHNKGISVSATIRLHQLSQTPPPADRGVLMMYNTGDFTDFNCHKPILHINDAVPYLRSIASYQLPLSAAYPIYGWSILFRGGQYVGIMHSKDEYPVLPGDSIIRRAPAFSDIMTAKQAIGKHRYEANDEVILFDLNSSNIKRFKDNDYEKIFSR